MSKRTLFKSAAAAILTALLLAMAGCGPDPFHIEVASIEDVPKTGTAGTPLALTGTVRPAFASSKNIVWSVKDARTTGASISGNILNAGAVGIVVIRATVSNGMAEGKDYTQDFLINMVDGNIDGGDTGGGETGDGETGGGDTGGGDTGGDDTGGGDTGITLSETETHVFASATVGYTAQAAYTVTVTNTGDQATGSLTIALSGTNAGSFTLSKTSITNIAASGTDTFTVSPNTGLAVGTYTATVTVSGGNGISANFTVSFTVNGLGPTYGITLSHTGTYTFTSAAYGYGAQSPHTLTITNTGNQVTGALSIALSGTNVGSFTLSKTSITDIAVDGTNTFTVVPNTGLAVGTYTATVTVSGGNGISANFNVSFTVNKAAGAAVSAPTVSGSPTSDSITVNAVTLVTATGQSIEYAISTASGTTPTTGWQSGTTFTGLTSGTTYYVYARSASNTNYNVGTASVSAGIATASPLLIEMVSIPAGTFIMGSPDTEPNRNAERETQHSVTLTQSFYMGKYQVTQEQYQAVMGSNPSNFTSAVGGESGTPGKLPVERVSWYDALVFCNKLSMLEGLEPVYSIGGSTNPSDWGDIPTSSNSTWNNAVMDRSKNGYRLPTEAEWEYACRAGTTTAYNTGSDTITDDTGWYSGNSGSKTHQVGLKSPNAWGLYDMHGNVREWCWDWYDTNYYSSSPANDPLGASSGTDRVFRGGVWIDSAGFCRSAYRGSIYPYLRNSTFGFRLVRPN